MMRTVSALVAFGGVASSALAGFAVHETLEFGGAVFPAHASATTVDDPIFQSKVLPGTAGDLIAGFRITFDYNESVLDASWASDAAVAIEFDGAIVARIGGSFGGMGVLGGTRDETWDFNGSGSDNPGTYSHVFTFDNPIATPDSFRIYLTDTFNGGNSFLNITVDLLVPAPGAAAVLGLAGLAGIRRRR